MKEPVGQPLNTTLTRPRALTDLGAQVRTNPFWFDSSAIHGTALQIAGTHMGDKHVDGKHVEDKHMGDKFHGLELKVAMLIGANQYLVEKVRVLEREVEGLQRGGTRPERHRYS